jgi:tetratricopeptide (TPR) repeat protein
MLIEAYYARGLNAERMANFTGAIDDYTQTLQFNKNHIPALMNRGNCYLALRRAEVAISDYDRITQIQPSNALAYTNIGRAHKSLGRAIEAKDNLQLAAQLATNQGDFSLNTVIQAELASLG